MNGSRSELCVVYCWSQNTVGWKDPLEVSGAVCCSKHNWQQCCIGLFSVWSSQVLNLSSHGLVTAFDSGSGSVFSASSCWVSENSLRSPLSFVFLQEAQSSHHPLGCWELQPSTQPSLLVYLQLVSPGKHNRKCSPMGSFPWLAGCAVVDAAHRAASLYHYEGTLLAQAKSDTHWGFSLVVEGRNTRAI